MPFRAGHARWQHSNGGSDSVLGNTRGKSLVWPVPWSSRGLERENQRRIFVAQTSSLLYRGFPIRKTGHHEAGEARRGISQSYVGSREKAGAIGDALTVEYPSSTFSDFITVGRSFAVCAAQDDVLRSRLGND